MDLLSNLSYDVIQNKIDLLLAVDITDQVLIKKMAIVFLLTHSCILYSKALPLKKESFGIEFSSESAIKQ